MKYTYLLTFVAAFFLPFFSFGAENAEGCGDVVAAAKVPVHAKERLKLPMYPIALEHYFPTGTITDRPFKPRGKLETYDFNIKRIDADGSERTVGVLYLMYDEKPDPRYYKVEGPILRIRNLSIGDVACPSLLGILDKSPLQKNGYGSMALEILFKALRESPDFSNKLPIYLEAPTYVEHLVPWYTRFGFRAQHTPQAVLDEMVQYMAVRVGQTQFPYYKKNKPVKGEKPE